MIQLMHTNFVTKSYMQYVIFAKDQEDKLYLYGNTANDYWLNVVNN